MSDASMKDVTKFMECKRVAFVGVSRNPQHFSRSLFREFAAKGYDPVPVNPLAADIDGRKCFARVADIAPAVEAALLMTGAPEVIDQAMRECDEAHIRNIWIYKAVQHARQYHQVVEDCRRRGASVLEGQCPFMFLPQPALVHRFHRGLMKIFGTYPR
jgi:predicted CoA-binding protein